LPVLGLVIVASGSRGPLLATIIAAFILYALSSEHRVQRLLTVIAFGALAFGALSVTSALLPSGSLARIEALMQGQVGASESRRWEALVAAANVIPTRPLGLGFGGFATKVNLWPGEERQFPHNIVAEVFVETGWLAGVYFVGLLWFAFYRIIGLRRINLSRSPGPDGLLAFLTFLLINELVSGEMNDSKVLFAFLAITLGYQRLRVVTQSRTPDVGASSIR
jgi:O-antigen ligase